MTKLAPYQESNENQKQLVVSLKQQYCSQSNESLVRILEKPAFSETYDAAFEILLTRGYFQE